MERELMPKRILVVDDSTDTLEMYKAIIAKEGHEVETAHSGRDALSKLNAGPFDLVLLDVFMPGMSGREVAEAIRANPKLKNVKIAFLTIAERSTTGKTLVKDYAPVDYIQKPVALKEFLARLRGLLS